jgi:haloalkane dehalogenase
MLHAIFKTLSAALMVAGGVAFAQSDNSPPEGMKEQDHLRNVRYCEILLVTRHGLSATAAVYNTLGLNDCPEQQWTTLDPDHLKKENNAYRVVMNGPRYFTMDRTALRNPGPTRNFDGLQAKLLAQVEINKDSSKRLPYTENTVSRESQYVYEPGKNVYELLAPDGRSYIMQSYSLEVDPNLNEEGLARLSGRLTLPKGWQYRVRKLSEPLIVRNTGSKAYVLQDNFRNSYQRYP